MATASFTLPGLAAPQVGQLQQAGQEQQLLAKQLAEQESGLAPNPADGGRYKVLNLQGLANAILAAKTKAAQETAQRKQADLQGAYQQELVRALKSYNGEDPGSVREGLTSPYPEIQQLAGRDQARLDTRFNKLTDKASLPSAANAGGDPRLLTPEQKLTMHDGVAMDLTPGQKPSVAAGGFTQKTLPDGTTVNVNTLTGEQTTVNKAPKTTITNSPAYGAESAYLKTEGEAVAKRGQALRDTAPRQFAALDRAVAAVDGGAFQGPVSNYVQLAAGLAREFGMAGPQLEATLKRTETLNSDMGMFVLRALEATGTNPSNADREYAAQIAGGQKLSPAGLKAVIAAAKKDIAMDIEGHNRRVEELVDAIPSISNARVRLPGVGTAPAGNPALESVLDKYAPRGAR